MYMYVHSYMYVHYTLYVYCMYVYSVTDTCIQTVLSMTGGTYFVAFRIYEALFNDCMYRAMLVAYPTDIL